MIFEAEHAHTKTHKTGSIPHGGVLVNAIATGEQAEELRERAAQMRKIQLNSRQISDIELIGNGAFSPLTGFMGQSDYNSVITQMRLANGLPWSIPITLDVDADSAPVEGETVALHDQLHQLHGILHVQEVYPANSQLEAVEVYGTDDPEHPGVAYVLAQRSVLLGGPITLLPVSRYQSQHYFAPVQTRAAFSQRGWKTIVGFQTRNPVHRAHEYIQKCAMEIVDGLLLHPLVGDTKSDDIPADIRIRCYEVLLANYYPQDRVMLSVLPAAMRYAGPREAIFHALVRKNFGCTHFIVGRDHAGVGSYYGTYDAQKLFDQFSTSELGIIPLKFDNSFYCRRCGGMASEKTCSHDPVERVALSGTAVRSMLKAGQLPPPEFSRPEVASILVEAMQG